MRLTTLCLSLLLSGVLANAQVTITQNEMPHAGDQLFRTQAVLNPLLNYSNTGPNSTWNYTNLVANGQGSQSYQTVGSTNIVYSLVYADLFFNGNRANHVTDGVDIPFYELLPIEDPYTFYFRSSSVYRKVGYGAEVAGIPIPITMSQQDVIYQLPLNFGNTSTSNSRYNIDIPTLAYYGYSQERVNTVDGWGVVNTPAGSFNALRVKTTIEGRDTIQVDQLSLGFGIERPLITEYKWLSPGRRVPVLQINTARLFGTEIITGIFFFDEPRSITVNTPLADSFCPGQQLQVNYTRTGVFNPGSFLMSSNVFRAQLSDASGSFASPVNIGSVTSTQSGVINATIPANTPPGLGYRIRVIATSPGYTGTSNTFDITIGTLPAAVAQAAGSTEFCAGGTVSIDANTNAAYTYQWQMNGSDIAGATASNLEVSDAGTYRVVVSTSCGAATSTAVAVVVNALPEHALIAPAGSSTCAGVAAVFSAQDLSGQSDLAYQWLLDGQAIAGETTDVLNTMIAGSYFAEITNTVTGCTFITAAEVLSVESVSVPALQASGATTVCEGQEVELEAFSVAADTYQWYLDGVAIAGADASTLAATGTGSYTATAISANGCISVQSDAVQIALEPLPTMPTITAMGNTTFCAGDGLGLIASGDADVSWQWSLNGDAIVGATDDELTVSASGAYSVTTTNAFGCVAEVAMPIDVVVNALPPVPAVQAADAVVFCEGGAVTLIASGANGATYNWTFNSQDVAGATQNQYVAMQSGAYAAYTVSDLGCSSALSAAVDVTVNPLPSIPVITAEGPTEFCDGGMVILTATGDAGSAYTWYLDGSAILGAGGSGLNAEENGDYTVLAADGSGCVSLPSVALNVTVEPLPTVPVLTALDATTFCAGGSAVLMATTDTGASLQWSLNDVEIAGANGMALVVNVSGEYTAIATSAAGCSSAVAQSVLVTVQPAPAQPVLTASGATSFCDGESVELQATTDTGLQIQWTLDGDAIDGAVSETLTVSNSGSYAVSVTDANGCSATSTIATVISSPVPDAVTLTASGSASICEGSSVDLQAGIAPGISYTWYLDGAELSGVTSQTYSATAAGNYTVVAVSSAACVADASNTIAVTVASLPDAPQITLTGSPVLCDGSSTTLVATTGPGLTYVWSLEGAAIAGATASQYTATAAGTYSLIVSNSSGCSANALTDVEVVVNALPDAPVVSLDFDVLSATGPGAFQWFLNGTAVPGATGSELTTNSNGVYTVSTTNANGCTATSEPFTVSTVGMEEASSSEFAVFPNPNNGQFTIQLVQAPNSVAYYTLYDATGRLVQQQNLTNVSTTVTVADARSGMYFLQVLQNGVTRTERVVIGQ